MRAAPNRVQLSDSFVAGINVTKPARYWDTGPKAQPGLVLVALPSGSKTYYCYYTRDGRKRWLRIGDGITVATARYVALGIRSDVVRTGADPVAHRQIARSSGTVAELITAYIASLKAQGRRSWDQTESNLHARVLERWGKQPAGTITRADVRVLKASMSDVPIMANSVLAAVSGMFNWAIANDFAGIPPNHANPAAGVEHNATKERTRVASDDELRALWPHLPPVLRLVLLCGCRPGEAMNLRSVDIRDGHWCQPGAPVGRWLGTKNGRDHDIYITPAIAGIVTEVADRHYRERTVADLMTAACKAAGFAADSDEPEKLADPVKPHDLRRTWATRCAGAGYTDEQMDRLLNHMKRKKVTRTYNRHQYRVENAAIWTKVAGIITSVIEGKSANVVSQDELEAARLERNAS
jgi:integrase